MEICKYEFNPAETEIHTVYLLLKPKRNDSGSDDKIAEKIAAETSNELVEMMTILQSGKTQNTKFKDTEHEYFTNQGCLFCGLRVVVRRTEMTPKTRPESSTHSYLTRWCYKHENVTGKLLLLVGTT